ncbi:hypothetical protein D3C81_2087030 [compost metagenome]
MNLEGIDSYTTVSTRLGIRSKTQLQEWVKKYKAGEASINARLGGFKMTAYKESIKDHIRIFYRRYSSANFCIKPTHKNIRERERVNC